MMDRRTTLATLMGRQSSQEQNYAPVTTGLEPYSGPWERLQVLHLLRRATFGPTRAMIAEAEAAGFAGTMALLFAGLPMPAEPVMYYPDEDGAPADPVVPYGESWVNAHYIAGENLQGPRNRSLRSWTLDLMMKEGIHIREKMTLFWHNHFAINGENEPNFTYRYIDTIRSQSLGNFKQLVKDITIDPAILLFLNGNQNTKTAPNENFARELLELFTVGKGELAGPGDYGTFTEDDVIQMARVLTGWRFRGRFKTNPDAVLESYFTINRHDTEDKPLSHRFGNAVISNAGENEYSNLVDVIFEQDATAFYICQKLYRWFVYYKIDDNAAENVIAPMAQMLQDNDFEIKPVVEALLGSTHFFDMQVRGPMIKHPLDFFTSIFKNLELPLPAELTPRMQILYRVFLLTAPLEMIYFDLPSVAGWKAYYQEPQFYRTWINATTLQLRAAISTSLASTGYNANGNNFKIMPLELISEFEEATDVNRLLEQLAELLFPLPLTDGQKIGLKQVLIPGLPDFEWTVEYSDYLANPDDENIRAGVENKLRTLLLVMLNQAEFQLI